MSNDPIALLERELVSAAHRRAAAGPVPGVLPWPRARRRRIRVGDALSAAAAAGAAIVALAALALLRGGGGGHPASTATATPRNQLLATTTPWGERAVLAPTANGGKSLTVFGGPGGSANTVRGFTAQAIAQGRGVVDEAGIGPARRAIRFLVVVPDGVAKVSVVFARPPVSQKNTIELLDQKTPHGNVVAFQELGAKPATPWLMTWETRTGKVMRRIPLPRDLG